MIGLNEPYLSDSYCLSYRTAFVFHPDSVVPKMVYYRQETKNDTDDVVFVID